MAPAMELSEETTAKHTKNEVEMLFFAISMAKMPSIILYFKRFSLESHCFCFLGQTLI